MPLGSVFRCSKSRPRFAEPTNKPDTQLILSLLALKHDFRKLPVQPHPSILKTLHSVAGKDKILQTINDKFIMRTGRKPMPGATKDALRFMAGSPKKNGLVFDNKANELQGENTPIQVHPNPNYVLVYRSPISKRIARIENPPWFLANYALSTWLHKKHRTINNALKKLRYDDLDLDESEWKNENGGYQVLSLPTPKGRVPKRPEGPFTHLYHYAWRPIKNARKGVLVKTSNQIYTHTYPFWKWGPNRTMRVRIKIPTSVLQKATHSYGGAAPKGLQKTSMYPIGSAYRANGERFGTIILPGFWGTINDISNDGLEVEITYLGDRGGSLRSVRSSPSPKPNGPRGKRQKTNQEKK